MSFLCLNKVFKSFSDLKKGRELLPLIQYLVLTYIWTHTAFYQQYTLLAVISLSILFYLINGKVVIAFVTDTKMKLLHLELLYLLVPAGILALEKTQLITSKVCDSLQIKVGIIIVLLHVERLLTYSLSIVFQVIKCLGFGFFEMPKNKT